MSLTIIKLGGEHADRAHLTRWLEAAGRAEGEVVIVPGGGPFAAAVRQAQALLGYDDALAHDLALLAMTQFGMTLAAIAQLPLGETERAMNRMLEAGETPIWSPWPMLRDEPQIAKAADVAGDSIALWLASRMRARRLIIAKATPVPSASIADLATAGVVDRGFPRFLAGFAGTVAILGPEPPADFADAPARAIG